MRKLLSIVLIFALLLNTITPVFAQAGIDYERSVKNIYNETARYISDQDLKNQLQAALNDTLPFARTAARLISEIEAAWNAGQEDLAYAKERELAEAKKRIDEYIVKAHDIHVEQLKDNAYKNGMHRSEIIPASVPLGELTPLTSFEQFQKDAEAEKIEFQQLVHYVRPTGDGSIYSSDPMTVAVAAQMIGEIATNLQGDSEQARRFADNELFSEPDSPTRFRSDLLYIQKTMLRKLTEINAKERLSVEDVQAVGSLRVALLRILTFYFKSNIPNPLYFYDISRGENTTGQETDADRKHSQEVLMERMHQAFMSELKGPDKFGGEGEEAKLAKMAAAGSFAVLYTTLYKPNDNNALFTLFKAVETPEQKPLKQVKWADPERNNQEDTKYWEDPDNELEQNTNAVLVAMLATVTDIYKNNGKGAPYAFFRAIAARPGEGYSGRFFPLLVRMTALEEGLSFQPAKGSDFANFVAYQTLTMYCPLVAKGASSVYGLDAKKGMPELATRLAAIFSTTYASPSAFGNNSTQSYLKRTPNLVKAYSSDPLRGVICGVTTDFASNVNQDAVDAQIMKTHLRIVEEAIFWIYGGKLLQGAFGILKRAFLLPVVLVRSVKVGYNVYRDVKVAARAQRVIELSRVNSELYESARSVMSAYREILATAARVKDLNTLRYYQKFVTEAQNIVLKTRKGTATAQQARNAKEIERVGKEIETLTKELDQARREITEIETAMQGAKEIDIAKAVEKTAARAERIEHDLQKSINTLKELSTGEKVVVQSAGAATQTAAQTTLELGTGATTATAQAAAEEAAAKAATSFTDGASVAESYSAYESAFRQAASAAGRNFSNEMIGMRTIKGFLRRNSAQLVFEIETEGGKIERMVIDSNRACRKWAGKARKAYIRQNTFTTPSWFELSEIPAGYADLGRMFRGAKQSMQAAKAAGQLEEGFRTYTFAQSKALNEIIRTRSTIARQVAKDGGVDVYVEVVAPRELVYSAEGKLLSSTPAKTMYWKTGTTLPEGYVVKSMEDTTIYILPKGAQSQALVTAEAMAGHTATSAAQLEKTLFDTLLDQTVFAITGRANPSRFSTMLEKLTQKFYKNDFTTEAWIQGNVAANLAVSPTTIVVNSGKNLFTRVFSGALAGGPQARVNTMFLNAATPKFVPEGLKQIYFYGSKLLKSEFAMNLYFFEALHGLDQIQALRDLQTNMLKEFSERDLEKELQKYPHLRQAIEEEKANPSNPKIAEAVQQASATADSQYTGIIITAPLFAARRFLSDVRSMSGTSGLSWLDFNTISDLQRQQFQMREKQLILKPIVEKAMNGITADLFDKSLDEQKEKLMEGDEFEALIKQDPTLKKDLENLFEQHRRDVKEIISQTGSSQQEQTQAMERASKKLEKGIHDRILKGQENSYKNAPAVKGNKKLTEDIHQAFEAYRKQADKIFNNSSLTPETRQKQLEAERTKLNEDIAQKISDAQEKSLLDSPEVKALIKEEGNNSQLKKDIQKAFKDYRAQERALTKKYDGTDKGQAEALKRELEAEQRKLNAATTKAIQMASLRVFKNSPTMKAFIEIDPAFEKEVDALFNTHTEKLISVVQSAALPQAQKEKRIKTLNEELSQGIFDLQMKEMEKMDLKNPEVLLFCAAYPALKNDLHQIYQGYKRDYQALQKQQLSDKQLEEKIKEQEQNFLKKKQELVQKYFTQSQSDIHFWRNVASNVNKQQWAEIAAMRQSVNQYLLLQNIPDLNEDALELINQQLVIFMEQQIAFYDDPSITNLDIAMRALMLEENNYLGSLTFLCGDQSVMEQYGIENFDEKNASEEGDLVK